ncbi:MetQ/NlpA family ABC transporter substrate-binding protein [Bacillus sp. MRMR6]|uniref:MetQ/NlpA family ABC transporter substrate-binding protein n=1 Tax=Bacillus sp. MRMR6 TaxID=1928617 RepID=UPI0009533C57|nr:MetQ/NlpA family ABC transporter substrate-binding protein [Bacillus sp. MRMR6]OLS39267.1 ABC transporter substrate-binding protein [Bacillus sp. MRMR6]
MIKKIFSLVLFTLLVLTGCSGNEKPETAQKPAEEIEEVTLEVATLIPPMTDILEIVKPLMKEEGINLEIVVLGDNVQPNNALANKEVDANFFQHIPYMEEYNKANGSELVLVKPIYHAVYGAYSKRFESIDDLSEGATIAIANDPTNIGRSLDMLSDHGIITLKEGSGIHATQADIVENEKNYKFVEVDLLMLARMLDDADLVAMTPAYAAPLGLTPKKDALLTEGMESAFAISLVARADNADSKAIQLLVEKMTGPEVRKFLEEEYAETALPAFE